jgi:pilus assembly protein Flp/PilA
MKKMIVAFVKDEQGLTMVEYAVAGGMIAAAGVVAFQLLGANVDRIIRLVNTALDGIV